jgi:hypothetical protein
MENLEQRFKTLAVNIIENNFNNNYIEEINIVTLSDYDKLEIAQIFINCGLNSINADDYYLQYINIYNSRVKIYNDLIDSQS